MRTSPRYVPVSTFGEGPGRDARDDDFDAQLYAALRASPWWMISIAAHVLVFAVLALLAGDAPADVAPPRVEIAVKPPADPPIEPPVDPLLPPDPPQDFDAPPSMDPRVVDTTVPDDRDRTDADADADEVHGDVEDTGSGPTDGVSTSATIGLGGGWKRGGKGFGDRRATRSGGPRGGGGERAVEDALRWLAAHQSPDGGWEAEGFSRWCEGRRVAEGPDGAGKAVYDVGVSGLAVLAFLGAGYTQRSEGPFGDVVRRGLRALVNAQDAEGCFGARSSSHYVYNHAVAALAVVEAYGMTASPMLKNPAQKALDFIALARNPYFAWRYGVKPGDNDTSVTGWMMMALKSARTIAALDTAAGRPASLQIDVDALDGVRSWIAKMTDESTGRVGYQQRGSGPARPGDLVDRFPADLSEAMTAVGVLARVFLDEDPRTSEPIQRGVALMGKRLPVWDPAGGGTDLYYWYYATLALHQVGGPTWKAWDAAMKPAIVDSQRRDGDYCGYKGSWDPIDPWGGDGGRVYSTAVNAMCLQVYYRYDRVFGTR